jgi:hypothetical protein
MSVELLERVIANNIKKKKEILEEMNNNSNKIEEADTKTAAMVFWRKNKKLEKVMKKNKDERERWKKMLLEKKTNQ